MKIGSEKREGIVPKTLIDTKNDKPVILFGGKGGVGKTTCSAVVAVQFASLDQRTIIITSDMTPSLSDIFEKHVLLL